MSPEVVRSRPAGRARFHLLPDEHGTRARAAAVVPGPAAATTKSANGALAPRARLGRAAPEHEGDRAHRQPEASRDDGVRRLVQQDPAEEQHEGDRPSSCERLRPRRAPGAKSCVGREHEERGDQEPRRRRGRSGSPRSSPPGTACPCRTSFEPTRSLREDRELLAMNGTHAWGVHGPMETIVTGDVVGQPVAFEAFFEAERARLLRALYLLTGNGEEAEEVLQESFIAVWERWDRVGAMEDPTGYLYRTALNRYRSRLRRVARAARLRDRPGTRPRRLRRGRGSRRGRPGAGGAVAAASRGDRAHRTAGVQLGGCRPRDGRRRRHRSTPGAGRPRRPPQRTLEDHRWLI